LLYTPLLEVQDNTANYTLQLKDLKDKERYLIWNAKSIGGNNELGLT
jgi:hypothetical protein